MPVSQITKRILEGHFSRALSPVVREGTDTAALALDLCPLATAHDESVSFGLTSEVGQVGTGAWFGSVLVHSWLSN